MHQRSFWLITWSLPNCAMAIQTYYTGRCRKYIVSSYIHVFGNVGKHHKLVEPPHWLMAGAEASGCTYTNCVVYTSPSVCWPAELHFWWCFHFCRKVKICPICYTSLTAATFVTLQNWTQATWEWGGDNHWTGEGQRIPDSSIRSNFHHSFVSYILGRRAGGVQVYIIKQWWILYLRSPKVHNVDTPLTKLLLSL